MIDSGGPNQSRTSRGSLTSDSDAITKLNILNASSLDIEERLKNFIDIKNYFIHKIHSITVFSS